MSEVDFLDYYLEFQDQFKPVKYYPDQKDIIRDALRVLVEVINHNRESAFIKNIKLVYPNYFTEADGGQLLPIIDELICYNPEPDNPAPDPTSFFDDNDLKQRVLQHMSYYLAGKEKKFIRISKTLLKNEKLKVNSFYVRKKEGYNYEIFINKIDGGSKVETPVIDNGAFLFPIDLSESLIKGGISYMEKSNINDCCLWKFSPSTGEQPALDEAVPETAIIQENDVAQFCELFRVPLSSHYIMLEHASLLYVYSQTAQINKEKGSLGYGGLFVLLKDSVANNEIEDYVRFFRLIGDCISTCVAHNIMRDKQMRESIKSAKAAIMSRNMSHNLGSHVMAYLKQHLATETNIINDSVLAQVFQNEAEFQAFFDYVRRDPNFPGRDRFMDFQNSDAVSMPFFVGLGQFISYLQERQDFIATIATDYIPSFSTVNFKDFIYDELNPDKRYERHRDQHRKQIDNILLGNIARSEGLGRTTSPTLNKGGQLRDIVLKFRAFNGNNDDKTKDDLEALRSYEVSLPGGLIGRQAIFSIMENIIRNAAKHGNWRNKGNLEITFDIINPNNDAEVFSKNDGYTADCLSLYEVYQNFYQNAEDGKRLYLVTLTDNTESSPDDVVKLRKALREKYVDDSTGVMESGSKGIKEMRISAAWLRALKDETECINPGPDLDNKNNGVWFDDRKWQPQPRGKAPLLYVRLTNEGNLQFIFCLVIPREVAIVTSRWKTETSTINNQLEKWNWKVFTPGDFKDNSYEITVVDDSPDCPVPVITEEDINRIRRFSSSRFFLFSDLKKYFKEKEFDTFFKDIETDFSSMLPRDYVTLFYKQLSKYDGEKITINDKLVRKRINDKQMTHCDEVTVIDGIDEGAFIYRTHHESADQFNKFMVMAKRPGFDPATVKFVEGISGNNSTDRLIRNVNSLDESWFYRHLRAMKQRVAIFDERLFAKVLGVEEKDFPYKMEVTEKNVEQAKQYYLSVLPENTDLLSKISKPEDAQFLIELFVNDGTLEKVEVPSKGRQGFIMHQKGISFFTFIKDALARKTIFDLVGVDLNIKKTGNYSYKCRRLAHCSWNDLESKMDFDWIGPFSESQFERDFGHKFDAITIHQGLLDKLYAAFFADKGNDVQKGKVLKGIFDMFSSNATVTQAKKDDELAEIFLPGICVHSGRSKPSEDDMPQHQPFIQYSAVEHATLDCKYSLVELLDDARYES